ncbi:MAG: tRNA (N6-isopentenyl adenosine(37)-C2)-methylthiotransferase MiaB [Clostridiales Family XIII bacterium]|jgi:tRNA-2-methylthio-N6-dimethylallyladenosine synthase|nr:tRNA (N6-isopentenyl adenosine(37)-C2)-methylthiotransferase MiaB [Clostridiales Family XIII bacterium]
MNTKGYYIETMGCQANERDSETLAGMLESLNYVPSEKKAAQVIIVNTCSVRDNADKRFFGVLGQIKKIKEARKDTIVCVCGCMMQQQHIIDEVKQSYGWVDLVFGTHTIDQFPELIKNVSEQHHHVVSVLDDVASITEGLPSKRQFKHKAFVNIMTGCNNFCTYCIVPFTRGREKSREVDAIVTEVKALVADGVKEITLLGQNVNSYEFGFVDLLKRLNDMDDLYRIRFMTSHPKDISDELIDAYTTLEKLHPYLHLPVQSGSSRILDLMNRGYTKEDYLRHIERLRAKVPGIGLSTDFIVGFPTETEEDFDETLDLIEKVKYDSAFTFIYSKRKGTPADSYEEQIDEEVKHERFNRMVDLLNQYSREKNETYIGQTVEVLCDGVSKTNDALYSGRTKDGKLINFSVGVGDDDGSLPTSAEIDAGSVLNVLVTEATTFSLKGCVQELLDE